MLNLMVGKARYTINCTIVVPEVIMNSLGLNCANYYQSNDPRKRAQARASDKAAQKQKLSKTDPKRLQEIIRAVRNADDSQFRFDCFEGNKRERSDLAFAKIVDSYNQKHKNKPITKQTLIDAVRSISANGYENSKIMQATNKPTPYDGLWAHVWHIPLSAVFTEHTDDYEWDYGDKIYLKLVFESEPKANGKYDDTADIHLASYHRDSDSSHLDTQTGKKASWWSEDTEDSSESEYMHKAGITARDKISGFADNKETS